MHCGVLGWETSESQCENTLDRSLSIRCAGDFGLLNLYLVDPVDPMEVGVKQVLSVYSFVGVLYWLLLSSSSVITSTRLFSMARTVSLAEYLNVR
jgi:hypothetical protein